MKRDSVTFPLRKQNTQPCRKDTIGLGVLLFALMVGCGGASDPEGVSPSTPASTPRSRGQALCNGQPLTLEVAPGELQTRGCVVNFVQNVADRAYEARFGTSTVKRRYILYLPASLTDAPSRVVFVFPGYGASAETAAVQLHPHPIRDAGRPAWLHRCVWQRSAVPAGWRCG